MFDSSEASKLFQNALSSKIRISVSKWTVKSILIRRTQKKRSTFDTRNVKRVVPSTNSFSKVKVPKVQGGERTLQNDSEEAAQGHTDMIKKGPSICAKQCFVGFACTSTIGNASYRALQKSFFSEL